MTNTLNRWWNPETASWTTTVPTASPLSDPGPALVDVRDMLVVHTALLREFRLAPAAVARVRADDVAQAAVVDAHLGFVSDLLHHHHEGEDELLWPKLRERVPTSALPTLDDAEAQHLGLDAALQRVATARTTWTTTADPTSRDTLTTELTVLHTLLSEHLDLEERAILPLAARLLTHAEWDALGEAAVAATPKPALPLVFGLFMYEGDPTVLKQMLQAAPALPRLLLPRIAPKLYARRARKVHGTSTP